jgi:hypothetical protein
MLILYNKSLYLKQPTIKISGNTSETLKSRTGHDGNQSRQEEDPSLN